ncbi:MAG: GNAT family N-acetyltransferase [Sphingomonas sp.]
MSTPHATAMTHRLAAEDDLPALREVMRLSIEELQRGFLSPEQVTASKAVMGLDTQLVADRTYFMVEMDGRIVGCGGWSRRATLYGGDHTSGTREPRLLNPATEAARVRAMYTRPGYARRGIGRLVLDICEAAAAAEGFRRAELMATMAGVPLYQACGYHPLDAPTAADVAGVAVPLVRMGKAIGG